MYPSLFSISIFLVNCIIHVIGQDPCDPAIYQEINDPSRLTDYKLPSTDTEACDRFIVSSSKWYRFAGDGNLPTESPAVLRCGSTGPIWLNGVLPTANTQTQAEVCQVGFFGNCELSWNIDIRNCGTFNVYQLSPPPACPGRYCVVGPPAPCQPGWGSETGFEPCSPTNITFAVTPTVVPYVPTFEPPGNQLTFECQAFIPTSNRGYVFDIEWTVDKVVVATKINIVYNSLKVNGSLYRDDWDPNKQRILGFKISCAIRARAFSNAPPTGFTSSIEFFAGIKVESSVLNVLTGTSAVIKVKSTVPVGCAKHEGVVFCTIRFELFSFQHQFGGNQAQCNQSLTQDPIPSTCGLDFDGERWNQYQSISVSALADQTTRPSYTAIVRLRAVSSTDTFWAKYSLPAVTVNVYKASRPKGYCSSVTDPNFRTLDGRGFSSMHTGEFVLYRIKNKPIAIHTIQDSSGYNCAVAVRAASDIFIIYGCVNRVWKIRRLNCNAENQQLRVHERSLGREFEVFLPTGTSVTLHIVNRWINIRIKPAYNDWQATEGLCGTYNGNSNDDFTDRNGNVVSTNNFVTSWSIVQSESLFVARIRNEVIKKEFLYCSCIPDADLGNSHVTEKADCSWRESLPLCKPLNWGTKECEFNRRRSAEDDFEIDVPEDLVEFKETELNTDWKNGWNETSARALCLSELESSSVYSQCSNVENINTDEIIEACVTDIRVSGGTTFLHDVKDLFKAECVSEMIYNATYWLNTTEESGSIMENVLSNDCPNDCSSAGVCEEGFCKCYTSFTGEDCSVNLNSGPTLSGLSEESLCDISKRPCTSMSLFGDGFYASNAITCKLTEGQFSGSSIVEGSQNKRESGSFENFGEVICPITRLSRRKRSTDTIPEPEAMFVSVSMDGIKYSSSVPVVFYNSACTSCAIDGNTITCDTRTDICVINGTCYALTENICRTTNDVVVENPVQSDTRLLWIIGISVASVVVVVFLIAVGIKYYYHKRYSVKDAEGPKFNMNDVGKPHVAH